MSAIKELLFLKDLVSVAIFQKLSLLDFTSYWNYFYLSYVSQFYYHRITEVLSVRPYLSNWLYYSILEFDISNIQMSRKEFTT